MYIHKYNQPLVQLEIEVLEVVENIGKTCTTIQPYVQDPAYITGVDAESTRDPLRMIKMQCKYPRCKPLRHEMSPGG